MRGTGGAGSTGAGGTGAVGRAAVATLALLATLLLVAGCSVIGTDVVAGEAVPAPDASIESSAEAAETPPSTTAAAAPQCANQELATPVGKWTTSVQEGLYFHSGLPVEQKVEGCLGYAIYGGGLGQYFAQNGTSASTVTTIIFFIDGAPQLAQGAYIAKALAVEELAADHITVTFDTKERGIDPARPVTVRFNLGMDRQLTAYTAGLSTQPRITGFGAQQPGNRREAEFSTGYNYSFETPDGAIVCQLEPNQLYCDTPASSRPVAQDLVCGASPSAERARSNRFGWIDFEQPLCAGVHQGAPVTASTVLNYGDSVAFTPRTDLTIICDAAPEGITCANPEGFAFFLSATDFRRYRAN